MGSRARADGGAGQAEMNWFTAEQTDRRGAGQGTQSTGKHRIKQEAGKHEEKHKLELGCALVPVGKLINPAKAGVKNQGLYAAGVD